MATTLNFEFGPRRRVRLWVWCARGGQVESQVTSRDINRQQNEDAGADAENDNRPFRARSRLAGGEYPCT